MANLTDRCKGFTLVELLVVIAIIGLLAGIGLPAYRAVMAKGAAAGCISNLRNLGVAINSYMADNDGRLPGPCYTGINALIKSTSSEHLAYELRNYLGISGLTTSNTTVKAVQCPGVTRAFFPSGVSSAAQINSYVLYSDNDMPSGKKLLNVDAGQGPFGNTSLNIPGWNFPRLMGSVNTDVRDQQGTPPSLSTIPAIYEPNNDLPYRGGKNWPWPVPQKCPHGKNMNVLFFDWHVGQVPANAYSPNGTVWK